MKPRDFFQSHFLKFFSFNIEGLCSKLEDHNLIEELGNYDIITLVETWLPTNRNIDLPGFYAFSKNRVKHKLAKRHSGGITVLIRTQLKKGVTFLSSKSTQFVWFQLKKEYFGTPRDIFVCATYIPPQSSKHFNQETEYPFDELNSQILKYKNMGDIVLLGDFNARTAHIDKCNSLNTDFYSANYDTVTPHV